MPATCGPCYLGMSTHAYLTSLTLAHRSHVVAMTFFLKKKKRGIYTWSLVNNAFPPENISNKYRFNLFDLLFSYILCIEILI